MGLKQSNFVFFKYIFSLFWQVVTLQGCQYRYNDVESEMAGCIGCNVMLKYLV